MRKFEKLIKRVSIFAYDKISKKICEDIYIYIYIYIYTYNKTFKRTPENQSHCIYTCVNSLIHISENLKFSEKNYTF